MKMAIMIGYFSSVREVTPEKHLQVYSASPTSCFLSLDHSDLFGVRAENIRRNLPIRWGSTRRVFAHSVREYSFGYLTGAYRRLVTKPDKVKFDFVRYSDPSADLAETDLARLQPVQHDTVKPAGKAEEGELLAFD